MIEGQIGSLSSEAQSTKSQITITQLENQYMSNVQDALLSFPEW